MFKKILSLLLFIGLAWGQVATSESPNDKNVSDKLIQSFRSDLGKFYTMTYYGEFLGKKKNKVYFKPINDAPLKLVRLKEIKKLLQESFSPNITIKIFIFCLVQILLIYNILLIM